jgi:hypothetical protein
MMCEKCWGDAYLRSYGTGRSQAECYRELLDERKDNPCTEEEQKGASEAAPGASQ